MRSMNCWTDPSCGDAGAMPPDGDCADGAAAETPLGGGVGTCSAGGANSAPVSPSFVIRVMTRLTSSRKYQTSQAMSAGQAAILRNSRKALTFSSSDISPAPKCQFLEYHDARPMARVLDPQSGPGRASYCWRRACYDSRHTGCGAGPA